MRALWIGFDLLPELPHIDTQVLGVGESIPQLTEQKFMGQHLARMLHQYAQQIVLLGRQLHFLVPNLDDTPHQVDRKIAGAENWTLAVRLQLVTQRRSNPREQLVHTEGLGDVVVGAKVEGLNFPNLVPAAGEDHDRDAFVARTYHSQ